MDLLTKVEAGPSPQRAANPRVKRLTTRVLAISPRGGKHRPDGAKRLRWFSGLVRQVVRHCEADELDAILWPGDTLRLAEPLGQLASADRRLALPRTREGRLCRRASLSLHERWPDVTLVVGLDSEPRSKRYGGDQFIAAWRNGELIGLARKAFPVDADTNGEGLLYWVAPDDAGDPGRIVTLRNGAVALLLACYDAFAVRALSAQRHVSPRAIRWILGKKRKKLKEASPEKRRAILEDWLALLRAQPPDCGLVAIHFFAGPGRDGYWQRHGIAGASSALNGRPVIGAAHFKALPEDPTQSPLAAACVRASHLDLGARRTAHALTPDAGVLLTDRSQRPLALARLFVLNCERNKA